MKIALNKVKKSIKIFIIVLLITLTFLYLNKQFSFFIPCIFHKITGLYCPGCGTTRMVLSILKGNIPKAFSYNPFMFILSPILIIYYIIYYINWIQDKKLEINKKIWYIILILAIIFMILRNIPEFNFLAPD